MNFKTLIVMMGLVGLMTVPGFAGSVTFDFVAFAAAPPLFEHGALQETFTESGLSVTASARNLTNTSDLNMYLDGLAFGGKDGGLGVCETLTLSFQCNPSSDDNLTLGEVLILKFDQLVTITEITFSNGDHEDEYLRNFGLAIDSTPISIAGFDEFGLAAIFTPGVPLSGMEFSFIAPATIDDFDDDPRTQMYISSITVTTVPEPSSLLLLGLGLLAGGVPLRKSFK